MAEECWERNIAIGDIPSKTDFEIPPEPIKPERPVQNVEKGTPQYESYVAEMRAYREARAKFDRMRQRNSVSCHMSMIHHLSIIKILMLRA